MRNKPVYIIIYFCTSCLYKKRRIKKTYGWIKATPNSRIVIKTSEAIEEVKTNPLFIDLIEIRAMIICPAIMFAVRRTDKVKGRIINLILSITTINGIRALGQPKGTKWANKEFKEEPPVIIIDNQNLRPKDILTLKWLVEVNTKGKSPWTFIIITKIKIDGKKQK